MGATGGFNRAVATQGSGEGLLHALLGQVLGSNIV